MGIKDYEMVIGLEVHVELKTKSKIFCGCSTEFGGDPNTQCCPICMGMPGTLPVLNGKVVDYAIKAGLATNCTIASFSKQDRKNYFYPDLPKAYQISQYDLPLCEHGFLDIESESGSKRIGITRIHIEEDAGKLVHKENGGTLIDYNRCGVPLIEIVSEPDIRSAEEAKAYLQKLRAIMLYVDVSDCKMNEGSFRCDVNLSVRKIGEEKLGTRTEMKNLNSFQFISNAIEFEFQRQVQAVENGEEIVQETRRYDQTTKKTFSMRKKEDAHDYRYFPDPDLMPIIINADKLQEIKISIPQLPDERKTIYMSEYGLTPYDAEQLVNIKEIADYFESAAKITSHHKILANLILSEIFRLLPQDSFDIPISPANLANLTNLIGDEIVNSSTAKKVIQEMWIKDQDPQGIVNEQGLEQINDETILEEYVTEVLNKNKKSVDDYLSGKGKALQAMIGQTMAITKGKGNPTKIQKILMERLK
ncbi:MAG: GatB [Clostridiales bacterium]|jgi:aspartyl-tRNA(Asn)/glutamyl-tRNA(Gln) amidotransferase subunit B|nr:GatB [Clostridiales bacterium]